VREFLDLLGIDAELDGSKKVIERFDSTVEPMSARMRAAVEKVL
jgi:hypothetical protein